MGQKSNSLILRSNQRHFEYNVKYIESNVEESTVLFYKSIELKSYLFRIFKHFGLIIHSFNLEYSRDFLNITIRLCSQSVKSNTKIRLGTSHIDYEKKPLSCSKCDKK